MEDQTAAFAKTCHIRRPFILAVVVLCLTLGTYFLSNKPKRSVSLMAPGQNVVGSPEGMKETQDESSQICNLPLLREKLLEQGRFPSNVSWEDDKGLKTLRPGWCTFQAKNQSLGQCLLEKSIKYVAIIGDSNGLRMFKAFGNATGKCNQVRREALPGSLVPNKNYYRSAKDDPRVLQVHQRDCTSCLSTVHACAIGGKNITVEFVSVEFLWDTEITSLRIQKNSKRFPMCGEKGASYNSSMPCPQSHSTLQFIYKEYFTRNTTKYPDLVLHFSGSHDKASLTADEVLMASEMLGRIFDMYVPPTTNVVFFSKPYEETEIKPKRWQNVTYEGKYRLLEQVQRFNVAIAKGLERVLRRDKSNVFVFFDLFTMGEGVAKVWVLDGVHKKPAWYQAVVKYFSMMYCGD